GAPALDTGPRDADAASSPADYFARRGLAHSPVAARMMPARSRTAVAAAYKSCCIGSAASEEEGDALGSQTPEAANTDLIPGACGGRGAAAVPGRGAGGAQRGSGGPVERRERQAWTRWWAAHVHDPSHQQRTGYHTESLRHGHVSGARARGGNLRPR